MVKPARVAGERVGTRESIEPALSEAERDVARTKCPVVQSIGHFAFGVSMGSAPVSGAGFRVPRKRTVNRRRLFRPTLSKSRLSLPSRQTPIPVVRQWTARRQRIVRKICFPTAAFFLASVVFKKNVDVFISTTADRTRMPGAAKLR